MSARPVFVVAGVGNGTGTGAATARAFAKEGYKVALISRNAAHLNSIAEGINAAGGDAAAFPVDEYSYSAVLRALDQVTAHKWASAEPTELRVALWNAAALPFKPFLDVTEADLRESLDTFVAAPFAFARQVVLAFRKNALDGRGKRGTLLFTGARSSVRTAVARAAFCAGKFGTRALSQSLAKEFGKENIHVAHTVLDSYTLTDAGLARRPASEQEEFKKNLDIRISPESVAKSYIYLANQDRSAWTWELDLRPAHETEW